MTPLPLTGYETLNLELDHDWLTIWFNRPEVRNALSGDMVTELRQVFEYLKDNRTIRGVTMRGRGGVFCAGGDLKGFRDIFQGGAQSIEDIARANGEAGELFDSINETPQVVVMLVEGAAIAGGFGIVCAGDVIVVAEDAKFAMTETSIGIPPAQIAPFVVARLGLRIARRLMLTAERFQGMEAEKIGLADYVAKDATQMNEIETRIRSRVRKCAPGANAVTKAIALATRRLDRPAMIEFAGNGFATCILSDEGREGIASFLEKRKPAWAEQTPKQET